MKKNFTLDEMSSFGHLKGFLFGKPRAVQQKQSKGKKKPEQRIQS